LHEQVAVAHKQAEEAAQLRDQLHEQIAVARKQEQEIAELRRFIGVLRTCHHEQEKFWPMAPILN